MDECLSAMSIPHLAVELGSFFHAISLFAKRPLKNWRDLHEELL